MCTPKSLILIIAKFLDMPDLTGRTLQIKLINQPKNHHGPQFSSVGLPAVNYVQLKICGLQRKKVKYHADN